MCWLNIGLPPNPVITSSSWEHESICIPFVSGKLQKCFLLDRWCQTLGPRARSGPPNHFVASNFFLISLQRLVMSNSVNLMQGQLCSPTAQKMLSKGQEVLLPCAATTRVACEQTLCSSGSGSPFQYLSIYLSKYETVTYIFPSHHVGKESFIHTLLWQTNIVVITQ